MKKSFSIRDFHWTFFAIFAAILIQFTIVNSFADPPDPAIYASRCFDDSGSSNWPDNDFCEYKVDNQVSIDFFDEGVLSESDEFPKQKPFTHFSSPRFNQWRKFISGTDLGISVKVPDTGTFYFYGDTHAQCYGDQYYFSGFCPRKVYLEEPMCPLNTDTYGPAPEDAWQTGPYLGLPAGIDVNNDGYVDGFLGWQSERISSSLFPNLITESDSKQDWFYASMTPLLAYLDIGYANGTIYFGETTTFLNQIERQMFFGDPPNTDDYIGYQDPESEKGFFVPTGAVYVSNANEDGDEFILYTYGKYIKHTACDQAQLGLMNLSKMPEQNSIQYVGLMSEQKFIQINMIPVEASPYQVPPEGECDMPWPGEGDETGFFIYGTGVDEVNTYPDEDNTPNPGNYRLNGSLDDISTYRECTKGGGYRKGSMYLAYVKLSDINYGAGVNDRDIRQDIWYYTGDLSQDIYRCWEKGSEEKAIPIEDIDRGLGEFSVMRIPGSTSIYNRDLVVFSAAQYLETDSRATLKTTIMHEIAPMGGARKINGSEIKIGVADLKKPWEIVFSDDHVTNGYGNYLIEDSLRVSNWHSEDNLLWFSRVISPWYVDILDARPSCMRFDGRSANMNWGVYGTAIFHAVTDLDDFVSQLSE